MLARYHISSSGQIVRCHAEKTACPKINFDSYKEAVEHINRELVKKYGPEARLLSAEKKKNSGARQNHGFAEENYMKSHYPLLVPENHSYSATWDAFINVNDIVGVPEPSIRMTEIIPVSIKATGNTNGVEMGSLLRMSRNKQDFVLSVGLWTGENKEVISRTFCYIPGEEWSKNFDKCLADKMANIFIDNNITNGREDDELWAKVSEKYHQEWNAKNDKIAVHFKRDHKVQKRVQCSIRKNYLNELQEKFRVDLKKRKSSA